MSQLAKSLKTRIEELTASIATQKTELLAYEEILHMELAKENVPKAETPNGTPSQVKPTLPPSKSAAASTELDSVAFNGNKTTQLADIVKNSGSAGVSPEDVDKVFSDRRVEHSKNFIYNTLSYLVSQKKAHHHEGRYYAVLTAPVTQNNSGKPSKRKLSAAGLKAIRDGVKKRWAAKREADRKSSK